MITIKFLLVVLHILFYVNYTTIIICIIGIIIKIVNYIYMCYYLHLYIYMLLFTSYHSLFIRFPNQSLITVKPLKTVDFTHIYGNIPTVKQFTCYIILYGAMGMTMEK